MLALKDVHAHYAKSHVLHGVSIDVGPGEVVGLLGRNGVGKSTTLKTVMGLVRASAGAITFEGKSLVGRATHTLPALGVAYVPEDRRVFRLLSVLENLRTGLDRRGVSADRRESLLEKAYGHFPVLRERRDQLGWHAVGREQQILAIARAMSWSRDHPPRRANGGPDAAHGGADPRDHGSCTAGACHLLVDQNLPPPSPCPRASTHGEGRRRHHARASELRANDAVIPSTWECDGGNPARPDPRADVNGLVSA